MVIDPEYVVPMSACKKHEEEEGQASKAMYTQVPISMYTCSILDTSMMVLDLRSD
jgi:hypothetical protein